MNLVTYTVDHLTAYVNYEESLYDDVVCQNMLEDWLYVKNTFSAHKSWFCKLIHRTIDSTYGIVIKWLVKMSVFILVSDIQLK